MPAVADLFALRLVHSLVESTQLSPRCQSVPQQTLNFLINTTDGQE